MVGGAAGAQGLAAALRGVRAHALSAHAVVPVVRLASESAADRIAAVDRDATKTT